MKIHELKCWPESFAGVESGYKRHELRKDDRGFEWLDILHLREWALATGQYTGRELCCIVTAITRAGEFPGLQDGYCCMSIQRCETPLELQRCPRCGAEAMIGPPAVTAVGSERPLCRTRFACDCMHEGPLDPADRWRTAAEAVAEADREEQYARR